MSVNRIYFWRSYNTRKAILYFVFFFVLFTKTISVFAQTIDQLNATYAPYLKLFTENSGIIKADTFTGATDAGVSGFNVDLQLITNTSDKKVGEDYKTIPWYWDRVSNQYLGSDVFVFKLCDVNDSSKCWLSDIATELTPESPKNISNFKSFDLKVQSSGIRTGGVYTYDGKSSTSKEGNFSVPKGFVGELSFWYCAGKTDADIAHNILATDGTEAHKKYGISNDRVTSFGDNFCGGTSYFKIGNSISISVPKDIKDIQSSIDTSAMSRKVSTDESNLPTCLSFDWVSGTDGSIMGCVANIVYYGIYWPISGLARLVGMMFDFFLGYSLSSSSYTADFAVRGWQLVRDISNIFFIIILVWTGFSTALGIGSVSIKKVVPTLIINALLINFSLFGTRVLIDLSNVVARVFYASMEVCNGPCDVDKTTDKVRNLKTGSVESGGVGYKPLSEKIMSAFNPQKMFAPNTLNPNNLTDNVAGTDNKNPPKLNTNEYATYFIIVSLIASGILIFVIIMFWKVSFLFLGRVIGLYIAMIFAPFAVLTREDMPIVGLIPKISWKNWSEELIKYSLLAPVFVFFLYVIYSFLDSSFLKIFPQDLTGSFFVTVISISVPMLIVFFMINQGVKIAEKFSGEVGKMVSDYTQKAVGLVGGTALGVASGGTALLGGRILGGGATALNNGRVGEKLRDVMANGNFLTRGIAKTTLGVINRAGAGSYDVRQTTIGRVVDKNLFSELGIKTDQKNLDVLRGVGLGLSTEQRKGGFESDVKRRQEEKEKVAKMMEVKMSDDQIKSFNDKRRADYEKKVGDVYEKELISIHGKQNVDNWKKNDKNKYEAEKNAVSNNPSVVSIVTKIEKPKEMGSVNEINAARRNAYAKKLEGEKNMTTGILGATVGSLAGQGVKSAGDKKAAKKIKEKSKIEGNLIEIENILKKGFQDLIAIEDYQNSPGFLTLNQKEKEDLIKYGVIKQPGANDNKHFYEILTNIEKSQVDEKIKSIKEDKTDAGKVKKTRYEEIIKTIEGSRFDMKSINSEEKAAKKTMIDSIRNNLSQADRDKAKKDWLEKLEEKNTAVKHQKTWNDVGRHIEDQRKKLKDDEKK